VAAYGPGGSSHQFRRSAACRLLRSCSRLPTRGSIPGLTRLARSTRDLLNVLDQIGKRGAGFKSLKDTWADTTTAHGRLMLTVLGG
jgi:DNA invertase Pin-like site-specific DNA recombinase